jgi:uncharacterized protein DUF262
MNQLKPTRTVFSVSQFLEWQRSGILRLRPPFQRRAMWDAKAKSLLIDTVVRGLPVPIVFLRQLQDLDSLKTTMEVVDGQQRLRALLSFIEPGCLPDYVPEKESFTVRPSHNDVVAGKRFGELGKEIRSAILAYEISTHVFPPNTGDEVVLAIFSRINSTGADLNRQELRNAQFYGEFKTLAYRLAFQNLPYWRKWQLFSDEQIARMDEVEAISDFMLAMMRGVEGKSQPRLDRAYKEFDDEIVASTQLTDKLQKVLDEIDRVFGASLSKTAFRRPVLFYSLFTACYDHMYGMAVKYSKPRKARPLPTGSAGSLVAVSSKIVSGSIPEKVRDAIERATADTGRRRVRHEFFMGSLGLEPAQ